MPCTSIYTTQLYSRHDAGVKTISGPALLAFTEKWREEIFRGGGTFYGVRGNVLMFSDGGNIRGSVLGETPVEFSRRTSGGIVRGTGAQPRLKSWGGQGFGPNTGPGWVLGAGGGRPLPLWLFKDPKVGDQSPPVPTVVAPMPGRVSVPVHDYKPLRAAVMIWTTQVNTRTHTQCHTNGQFVTG